MYVVNFIVLVPRHSPVLAQKICFAQLPELSVIAFLLSLPFDEVRAFPYEGKVEGKVCPYVEGDGGEMSNTQP